MDTLIDAMVWFQNKVEEKRRGPRASHALWRLPSLSFSLFELPWKRAAKLENNKDTGRKHISTRASNFWTLSHLQSLSSSTYSSFSCKSILHTKLWSVTVSQRAIAVPQSVHRLFFRQYCQLSMYNSLSLLALVLPVAFAAPAAAPAPAPAAVAVAPHPMITPRASLTDRTPSKVQERDVISSIEGLGSYLSSVLGTYPSYIASGVPNFFQDFPTGSAVESSLSISDSDLAATPTQVLNIP